MIAPRFLPVLLGLVAALVALPAFAQNPFQPPETYACGASVITIDAAVSRYYIVEAWDFGPVYWIYEEANHVPGVQRGGESPLPGPLGYEDDCDVRDERPGSLTDSLIY